MKSKYVRPTIAISLVAVIAGGIWFAGRGSEPVRLVSKPIEWRKDTGFDFIDQFPHHRIGLIHRVGVAWVIAKSYEVVRELADPELKRLHYRIVSQNRTNILYMNDVREGVILSDSRAEGTMVTIGNRVDKSI